MGGVFLSVLNMSLTASYVIAIIAVVRLFLKNAPKIISYMLWALAGFRLVVPCSFESVFSLIPFQSAPIPADIAMQPIPRVDSGILAVDHAVSRLLPAGVPEASINPLQLWQAAGVYVWLAGIAVMLTYSVVSILLLNRMLRGSVISEGNIYEAENLKTPFVLGFLRPKIYIPIGLCAEERKYIILHEQTHIKRFDHVVKLLAFLILCVHWFNPLVWAAFFLMSADMEMSCDERVLKEMGSDIKQAYSTSLLSMATGRRFINGSPIAFGEGNIKGRIQNILNFKKPAVWVIAVSVVLVVVLCIGLTANKAKGENSVPADEIRVEVTGDIPDAVIDYAKEYVGQQVDYYNETGKAPASGRGSYTITEARITGLAQMNTGTADLAKSISMWRLEYRLRPDHPDHVLLAGGMQMEDIDGKGWITEWGSTGQPYLLLVCDESGTEPIWKRICVTNTDAIEVDYGTPEMLERYGNEYTAAAMELYHKYVEGSASDLVPITHADVNQDGKDESIYLDRSQMEAAREVRVLVKDAGGNVIWSEALNLSHPGWGELFLTKLDNGKQYLLRYTPVMYQGGCTYTFSLFSPEKGGKEKVLRTETLSFDINGIGALNAREMVDFADEVNALLKKSTLLLSSNEGSWSFGPSPAEPFFEVYSWLDDPVLYNDLGLYKKGDSLETKLEKYSAYAISNRKLSDLLYEGYTDSHSDRFSEKEIRDAMESVIAKFRDFKGCEMTKLWYDEEKSNRQIESYMTGGRGAGSGVSKDNVIVIYSDFSVDSSGGDGSLNPNSTYTDWCWILVRDSAGGEWRVDDFGY